jgi:hypothetical protein
MRVEWAKDVLVGQNIIRRRRSSERFENVMSNLGFSTLIRAAVLRAYMTPKSSQNSEQV